MVTITVQLPPEVEEKARTLGILTGEHVAALIAAEVERQRQEAALRIEATMDALSAKFREQYGHLSEEEALAMIEQWVAEIDEADTKDDGTSPA